jgi:hypothetical protein
MIEITPTPEGSLRITPGMVPPLLADFLETDIGLYTPRAEEILTALRDTNRAAEVSFYGNLYSLRVTATEAALSGLFDETLTLTVSLDQLEAVVSQWHAALLGRGDRLD